MPLYPNNRPAKYVSGCFEEKELEFGNRYVYPNHFIYSQHITMEDSLLMDGLM